MRLLSVPRVKTEHAEAAFSYYAPNIWNKLPENCSSASTLTSSNSQLMTFVFATQGFELHCDFYFLVLSILNLFYFS